ncbi:hypothetical protein [Candidatus Pelagibacter sp.]|uniref:hypothetical protein n=1 Tax=Candidatus Pelagibacter sp. TaxID=2024849 RepID=UPI003F84B310
MLKVGFYLRELNFRGIANSIFIYAKNNQTVLKNKSIIFYNSTALDNKPEAIKEFKKKFKTIKVSNLNELEKINKNLKLDYIYFQRDGAKDELVNNSKNIIHAVFPQNPFQYHGSNYAFISKWLSMTCSNNKFPFAPLPVQLLENNQNLRNKLKIPRNAKVFGYHGGETSFDLIFVRDAIKKVVQQNKNIYFLFMNIKKFFNHKKVIFLKGTFNQTQKVKFINTCDAMLHARSLGESFGLSCAEFAIKNKPILTYGYCRQRAHFEICKNNIIPYYSYRDLNTKIINFNKNKKYNSGNLKNDLSEKKTIKIFKEILLNKKQERRSLNIIDYIMISFFFLQKNYFYIRNKVYINFYKIL